MSMGDAGNERVRAWLTALEERHLADLTASEVARALRALSSCYVERRARLAERGALDSAGKRAAFALFYAPVHFIVVREVARALAIPRERVRQVYDLGCGTGVAGAALALDSAGARVCGADRHPWAVAEANWTYGQLGIEGRAVQQDVMRVRIAPRAGTAIVAAYTINELSDAVRSKMLERLLDAYARGATVLVIEPIARGLAPWWDSWAAAFATHGRADEWRFPPSLPPRQRQLARAAGLDPRALTARTLLLGGGGQSPSPRSHSGETNQKSP